MRYTPWDPHVLVAFDVARLTRPQQSFVQKVLRSLDPDALFSEHSSAGNSAFLALTRAQHALASNLEHQQPTKNLLENIWSAAHQNLANARPLFGGDARLQAAQRLVRIVGPLLGRASDAEKRGYLRRLGRLIGPALRSTQEWVAPLWAGTLLPEVAESMTRELCVAIALRGRDGLNLKTELLQLLMQGPPTAERVARILWPPMRPYPVTLLVEGARELLHLEQLLPGSRQRALLAVDGVRQVSGYPSFARHYSRKSAVLVQFSVDAPDIATAMSDGRRKLSEVLDQYAAGQRIVQLSLHPVVYAVLPSGTTIQNDADRGSTAVARPLTTHWSGSLGPALRQANLAAQVGAPMASTSLSWSAIEALGVKWSSVPLLAKACALHALRQQLVGSHVLFHLSAGAHLRHLVWRSGQIQGSLERHRRAVEACAASPDSAGAQAALAEHLKAIADLEQRLPQAQSEAVAAAKSFETRKVALAEYVPEKNGRVSDPDCWLDVLLPARAADSADLALARSAADSLSQEIGGVAGETFDIWRARLSSPQGLQRWLDGQVGIFNALLYWMYSIRNAAMHSGAFSGPADTLTAHGARAVVDLVLEVLSNWQTRELVHGQPETSPLEIVTLLADRMDELASRLTPAQTNHALSVAHLTGPGFDAWSRV
jgi:hypothetical protein